MLIVKRIKLPEIGTTVIFACDLIDDCGNICHKKGDIATIADLHVLKGHWSRLCTDIWVEDELISIVLNEFEGVSFIPTTFEEFI